MTIPHFADAQNLVFLPALLSALIATVLICLPIVFAPGLRRRRGGRALTGVAFVAGAVALVVGGFQAGGGVRVLQAEREQVRTGIQQRYGLTLDRGVVGSLVDGGSPKQALPVQEAALGLRPATGGHALKLVATPVGSDSYGLTYGGKPLPGV